VKCEEEGMGNTGEKLEKHKKIKLKSENWNFFTSIKLVLEHMVSFLPRGQDNTTCRATDQHG